MKILCVSDLEILPSLVLPGGAPYDPRDPVPVGDPGELRPLLLPLLPAPAAGGGGLVVGGGQPGGGPALLLLLLALHQVREAAAAGGDEQEALPDQLRTLLGGHLAGGKCKKMGQR